MSDPRKDEVRKEGKRTDKDDGDDRNTPTQGKRETGRKEWDPEIRNQEGEGEPTKAG